jgi:hypothetical protein
VEREELLIETAPAGFFAAEPALPLHHVEPTGAVARVRVG